MQPYFLPFPGYFRLFAAADEVVLLDNVQFPKHGFVHRNQFRKVDGSLGWLPLPLARAPLDTSISDLAFAPDAVTVMSNRVRSFGMFTRDGVADAALKAMILSIEERPVDLIVRLLSTCCATINLPFADLRASALDLPPGLKGQDRVLAIAAARGAKTYVNLPGGRTLYDKAAFAARGIGLAFLPDYAGALDSIGQRLHDGAPDGIRDEILRQSALDFA